MHALELLVRLGPGDGLPWRRFTLAADASLGELHDAIQVSCDWRNSHLHAFIRADAPFGCSGWTIAELGGERGCPDPADVPMSVCLRAPGDRVTYWYDYGDDWVHDVRVDGIVQDSDGRTLIGGEGAFPPEDSGGMLGYEEVAERVRRVSAGGGMRSRAEEYRLMTLWGWHPDVFDFMKTKHDFDLERLPRRGSAPSAPALETILGGRLVGADIQALCAARYAQVHETHEPDDVMRQVRAIASAAAFEDSLVGVKQHLPDEPRGLAVFFELLRVAHERLRELAADDAPRAAESAHPRVAGRTVERRGPTECARDLRVRLDRLPLVALRELRSTATRDTGTRFDGRIPPIEPGSGPRRSRTKHDSAVSNASSI